MTEPISETGARVNAVAEWRSRLAAFTGGVLLFLTVTGLAIVLFPTARINEYGVLVHTLVGILTLPPIAIYSYRHWLVRRVGSFSHHQLLGYAALVTLVICSVSGLVETWQAIAGPAIAPLMRTIHLVTGVATAVLITGHLATVIVRRVVREESRRELEAARRVFFARGGVWCAALILVIGAWSFSRPSSDPRTSFPEDYAWRFGEDRPFAPSMSRLDHEEWRRDVMERTLACLSPDERTAFTAALEKPRLEPLGLYESIRTGATDAALPAARTTEIEAVLADAARWMKERGALEPTALAGSATCGTTGCHEEIYREWLPSAHRYAALDDLFQRVQVLMAEETSPEQTRYCAGCHDPISLFSGSKNSGNITLSSEGFDEGASCLVCHSIVQTDVQGNGDYTIEPPRRMAYEQDDGPVARFLADFVIRSFPEPHVQAYSRPLYKTAEFCAACHKQYIDKEVNTDIGKVQGQNQYDSWRNSRWHREGSPEETITCRECHMPLAPSTDPARGDRTDSYRRPDDGMHRGHGMVASNQYIPILHGLEGAEEHVAEVERWMRGEVEIPEIADRWVEGPVVRLNVVAPDEVREGDEVPVQVVMTNNKTGHDFPTGPLDMIESWVELTVSDASGETVFQVGGLDEHGDVEGSPLIFKKDGFDRRGELIDRHNLWDLVGASYARSLFPGVTDTVEVNFQCPSMARGRVREAGEKLAPGARTDEFAFDAPPGGGELRIVARLLYRKANPKFLKRTYGVDTELSAPVSEVSRTETTIRVVSP